MAPHNGGSNKRGPLWTAQLSWHVNTVKKKSETMRMAIREHESKWTAATSGERNVPAKDSQVGVNAVIYENLSARTAVL